MDNILKAINQIYDEDDDFFRIKDIINSENDNQYASKQWLVEELSKLDIYKESKKILIIGGWYGKLGSMLDRDKKIVSVDIDSGCKKYGSIAYPEVSHITGDGFDVYWSSQRQYDIVICTACEHIEQDDINFLIESKHKNTTIVLQSNNYKSINEHINCKDTLDNFAEELNFKEIIYQGELDRGHYKRFMVIGR